MNAITARRAPLESFLEDRTRIQFAGLLVSMVPLAAGPTFLTQWFDITFVVGLIMPVAFSLMLILTASLFPTDEDLRSARGMRWSRRVTDVGVVANVWHAWKMWPFADEYAHSMSWRVHALKMIFLS